jgi:hypothetical protein
MMPESWNSETREALGKQLLSCNGSKGRFYDEEYINNYRITIV